MIHIRFLTHPDDIYAQSFQRIGHHIDLSRWPAEEAQVILRVVHATADFEYADTLVFHPGAVAVAVESLRHGAPLVVDARMVEAGFSRGRLQRLGLCTWCGIEQPEVSVRAQRENLTRSMVGIEWAMERAGQGAVVVIGNAPTALFHVVDMIRAHRWTPSVVLGFPVGLIGALESKQELLEQRQVPAMSHVGTKGGSAVAAAAVNALLRMALGEAQ